MKIRLRFSTFTPHFEKLCDSAIALLTYLMGEVSLIVSKYSNERNWNETYFVKWTFVIVRIYSVSSRQIALNETSIIMCAISGTNVSVVDERQNTLYLRV